MSNELAILESGLPSYLRKMELDDATKALMGGSSIQSKRISIRGGVWRMLVNGKEIAKNDDRALNVVIVNAAPKVSRTFYAKTYSESSEVTAPDCWSADGDMPDAKAKNPQAKRCVDCPKNTKGSGTGDSRACRFGHRIAVVLANDINGDVFQLTVPGASVFGDGEMGKWPLRAYGRLLGSKGLPISVVVTEMRFDTDSDAPKINFRAVRVLEEAESAKTIEQGKTEAAIRAITMTVAEADGVTAQPAKLEAPKLEAKPEVKVEPKVEAPVVVEVKAEAASGWSSTATAEEEPQKRTKKEEAPAEKKDISSILAAWDDE